MKKILSFVLIILGLTSVSLGSVTALSYTTNAGQGGSVGYTMGWGFTLTDSVAVTELGILDRYGNGLVDSHDIGIWSVSGQTLQVSETIPSGTTAPLDLGFRYVTLDTPVILGPGNYRIGAFFDSLDDAYYYIPVTNLTVAPEISGISTGYFNFGTYSSLHYPSFGPYNDYFLLGPNFKMAAVPAPGAALLAAFGAGIVSWMKRRRTL